MEQVLRDVPLMESSPYLESATRPISVKWPIHLCQSFMEQSGTAFSWGV